MGFDTAVSGLKASTADLGIIGNNIANSSTTGYKSQRGEFADIFTTSLLGAGSNQVGKGVQLVNVGQSFAQGNISYTNNALDMAINGGGFFALNDGGSMVYTRAGNFSVDREGFVVNNTGARLQVFETTASGELTGQIGDLEINTALIEPNQTAEVGVGVNLDSRDISPGTPWGGPYDAFAGTSPDPDMFNASTSVTIYDSLGNPHTQTMYFVKGAGTNQWDVYTSMDGQSVSGPDSISFDSNGQVDTATLPVLANFGPWTPKDSTGAPNGAQDQSVVVDLSNSTQFGNEFTVTGLTQDGYSTGQLRGLEVDDSGAVFARFTNGQARTLGYIALASFSNMDGLQPLGNTSWGESFSSGPASLSAPGTGGLGVVQSGALEDSNVEITSQLVDMIVAQRNFQANAQVIQTEDTLAQTVINLR